VALALGTAGVTWVLTIGGNPQEAAAASAQASAPAASLVALVGPSRSADASLAPVESGPSASLGPPPTPGAPTQTAVSTIHQEAAPHPTATPTAVPTATPEPTPSLPELVVYFPRDGQTIHDQDINVVGTAPAGATVTHDVPMWFDDHVTVQPDGSWLMPVHLDPGQNVLRFRIGDDRATEIEVNVTVKPRA